MEIKLLRGFDTYFSFLKNEVASFNAVSDTELLIKLKNGDVILYDDIDKTIRNLPKDSNHMSEEECLTEFGERLRKIMKRKRISQIELSELSGIRREMLSRYLNGINIPSFYNADRIAKAVGCSLDDLRYLEE